MQLCKTENELNHLIELGCLLGIQEWTDVMLRNCQPQDSAIQILPSEVQELFEEDEQIQVKYTFQSKSLKYLNKFALLFHRIYANV